MWFLLFSMKDWDKCNKFTLPQTRLLPGSYSMGNTSCTSVTQQDCPSILNLQHMNVKNSISHHKKNNQISIRKIAEVIDINKGASGVETKRKK